MDVQLAYTEDVIDRLIDVGFGSMERTRDQIAALTKKVAVPVRMGSTIISTHAKHTTIQ